MKKIKLIDTLWILGQSAPHKFEKRKNLKKIKTKYIKVFIKICQIKII